MTDWVALVAGGHGGSGMPWPRRRSFLGINVPASVGWAREMYGAFDRSGEGAIVNVSSYTTVRPSPGIGLPP